MNMLARRVLSGKGMKLLPTKQLKFIRLANTDEGSLHDKPLCAPVPPPAADASCPQPPPCPPKPDLAARLCPQKPDPGNPCNYCPPCPESDEPDLSKIKKRQCLFQQDNGLPVHLKGGALDTVVYQICLILTAFGLAQSIYMIYKMAS